MQSSKTLGPTNPSFPSHNNAITTGTHHLTCTCNKMDLPTPSDLPVDAITTIIRRVEYLSSVAMHGFFGKMPYQW
jgi:hypothetical protein